MNDSNEGVSTFVLFLLCLLVVPLGSVIVGAAAGFPILGIVFAGISVIAVIVCAVTVVVEKIRQDDYDDRDPYRPHDWHRMGYCDMSMSQLEARRLQRRKQALKDS